jgi:hypothetical protein
MLKQSTKPPLVERCLSTRMEPHLVLPPNAPQNVLGRMDSSMNFQPMQQQRITLVLPSACYEDTIQTTTFPLDLFLLSFPAFVPIVVVAAAFSCPLVPLDSGPCYIIWHQMCAGHKKITWLDHYQYLVQYEEKTSEPVAFDKGR